MFQNFPKEMSADKQMISLLRTHAVEQRSQPQLPVTIPGSSADSDAGVTCMRATGKLRQGRVGNCPGSAGPRGHSTPFPIRCAHTCVFMHVHVHRHTRTTNIYQELSMGKTAPISMPPCNALNNLEYSLTSLVRGNAGSEKLGHSSCLALRGGTGI